MTHIDLLASGKLAVEFRPKYHDRSELRQILRTAFPKDFNFDDFDLIEPDEDPNGSVWFKAHVDDGEVTSEWTFHYLKSDYEMTDIIIVSVDDFMFSQIPKTKEEIDSFLNKYANE